MAFIVLVYSGQSRSQIYLQFTSFYKTLLYCTCFRQMARMIVPGQNRSLVISRFMVKNECKVRNGYSNSGEKARILQNGNKGNHDTNVLQWLTHVSKLHGYEWPMCVWLSSHLQPYPVMGWRWLLQWVPLHHSVPLPVWWRRQHISRFHGCLGKVFLVFCHGGAYASILSVKEASATVLEILAGVVHGGFWRETVLPVFGIVKCGLLGFFTIVHDAWVEGVSRMAWV